jgi:hypothetical protein
MGEYSGVNAIDQSTVSLITLPNGTEGNSANVTTLYANELLVGYAAIGQNLHWTVGAGWSNLIQAGGNASGSGSFEYCCQESEVVSVTGTYHSAFTSSTGGQSTVGIATFYFFAPEDDSWSGPAPRPGSFSNPALVVQVLNTDIDDPFSIPEEDQWTSPPILLSMFPSFLNKLSDEDLPFVINDDQWTYFLPLAKNIFIPHYFYDDDTFPTATIASVITAQLAAINFQVAGTANSIFPMSALSVVTRTMQGSSLELGQMSATASVSREMIGSGSVQA